MIMRCLAAILLLLGAAPAFASPPKIVVTLKPVHALIAGIMAGIGQPRLLLAAAADPHTNALRPSEARALAGADAVFWIGPGLEGYLRKPLANLATRARIVTLSEVTELRRLPARRGGIWGGAEDKDRADAVMDPHIWLDPRNAQAMVRQAVTVLSELDPARANTYRRNGDNVLVELGDLEAEIHRLLAPVRALPYLVLHDAYQYFEARFRTRGIGAIAVAPDRKPGARRISAIRQRLGQGKIRCLFREADFTANIVKTLIEGLDVRVAVLDPIGLGIVPGPDAYGQILRQLASSLENCLSYALGP
jgi:zinc transport system substrate-binding protein